MGRHTRYNGENIQDVQIVVLKAVLGILCDRRVAETLGQEDQGKMPKLRTRIKILKHLNKRRSKVPTQLVADNTKDLVQWMEEHNTHPELT